MDRNGELRLLLAVLNAGECSVTGLAQVAQASQDDVIGLLETCGTRIRRSRWDPHGDELWRLTREGRGHVRAEIERLVSAIDQEADGAVEDMNSARLESIAIADAYAEDALFAASNQERAACEANVREWLLAAGVTLTEPINAANVGGEDVLERVSSVEAKLAQTPVMIAVEGWSTSAFEEWLVAPNPQEANLPVRYRADTFLANGELNPARRLARASPIRPAFKPEVRAAYVGGLLCAYLRTTISEQLGVSSIIKRQIAALVNEVARDEYADVVKTYICEYAAKGRKDSAPEKSVEIMYGFAKLCRSRGLMSDSHEYALEWIKKVKKEPVWRPAYALVYLWLSQHENKYEISSRVREDLEAAAVNGWNMKSPLLAQLVSLAEEWTSSFRKEAAAGALAGDLGIAAANGAVVTDGGAGRREAWIRYVKSAALVNAG